MSEPTTASTAARRVQSQIRTSSTVSTRWDPRDLGSSQRKSVWRRIFPRAAPDPRPGNEPVQRGEHEPSSSLTRWQARPAPTSRRVFFQKKKKTPARRRTIYAARILLVVFLSMSMNCVLQNSMHLTMLFINVFTCYTLLCSHETYMYLIEARLLQWRAVWIISFGRNLNLLCRLCYLI
jgi:hypothetical protein